MSPKQAATNRLVLFLLLAAVLFATGYAMRHTFSCFLLSFVLAYLLDPFVVLLERHKLRRIYGIIVLYTLLGIFTFFFVAFLVPFFSLRWEAFIRDLPGYLQKGKEIALAWKTEVVPSYAAEEWSWLFDAISANLDKLLAKLGAGAYAAATTVVFNLFNLILAPILVFFMLHYKRDVMTAITGWLPPPRRETILELGREINASIGGYIRGQLIVSLIVAVLSSAALFLLDVDYAVFNGIFAGLASILPFIGVIIATIPALFFAYVKFQSGLAMLKVIAAFSAIYFLEGYVIKPLVFKEAMNLNPLVTIIVVMAFGELLGFWGILLAIPIAAGGKIFWTHLRRGDFATGE